MVLRRGQAQASLVGPSKGPGPVEEPTGQGWAAADPAWTAEFTTGSGDQSFFIGQQGLQASRAGTSPVAMSPVEVVGLDVGSDLGLPLVSVVQQLLLVV